MTIDNTKVVIVGGGTAGWLTAGILASRFDTASEEGVSITLVESPDIPTIGVGEGTWPSMRTTLQRMGVSETDFIRECDVSLKQGSRFNNWVTGQSDYYYHPYSLPISYTEFNMAPHWQKVRDQISFTDAVSAQGKLCDRGLAPKQISTPEYAFNVNYGYHLNAGKFAGFLKRHCVEQLGVKHILDNVQGVNNHTDGDIESVQTQNNGAIAADLFVDCSGFKSLLLGEHYGVGFNDIGDQLFNDSALTVQVPYQSTDDPIASHTLATAQSAGWVWDIGLPSRRGVGYVYSSTHSSEADAENELISYLAPIIGRSDAAKVEPGKIKFRSGYRTKFWHRNCVAVGLSAGFVEPLEASAIALVELSAKMIADQFPANRSVMDVYAKRFNQKFHHRWEQVIDFLKLHYVLNQREDSSYWKDHRNSNTVSERLQESLTLWRHQAPWHLDTPFIDEMFPSASFQYVLYGMGFVTKEGQPNLRGEGQQIERANQLLNENDKKSAQLLNFMPTNRELINKINEFGFKKI